MLRVQQVLKCKEPSIFEFINNPDKEHHGNRSPLMVAIAHGDDKIVEELVKFGADFSAITIVGKSCRCLNTAQCIIKGRSFVNRWQRLTASNH